MRLSPLEKHSCPVKPGFDPIMPGKMQLSPLENGRYTMRTVKCTVNFQQVLYLQQLHRDAQLARKPAILRFKYGSRRMESHSVPRRTTAGYHPGSHIAIRITGQGPWWQVSRRTANELCAVRPIQREQR